MVASTKYFLSEEVLILKSWIPFSKRVHEIAVNTHMDLKESVKVPSLKLLREERRHEYAGNQVGDHDKHCNLTLTATS